MNINPLKQGLSRPARARGLKQNKDAHSVLLRMSRPARARGLKHRNENIIIKII